MINFLEKGLTSNTHSKNEKAYLELNVRVKDQILAEAEGFYARHSSFHLRKQ
jgi:hypothetical protein